MIDDIFLDDYSLGIIEKQKNLLEKLSGKSILITGATGLIGSHLIVCLVQANRYFNLNIKIIGLVRSLEKASEKFSVFSDEIEFVQGDVLSPLYYSGDVDYIVHGASVTDSKTFVEKPVETIFTAIDGTKTVLDFAKEKQVSGFTYLSSLEVYGFHEEERILTETDFGYLDFTNSRSSYSEGKRMAECLINAYGQEYAIPTTIARLTQTFGPGVSYDDNRVFAQFARSAIEQEDIILHTAGETKRSYCYTRDAVFAILTILLKGKRGQAYNVANKSTYISIRELAEQVCQLDNTNTIRVRVELKDIERLGYNPTVMINLDTKKLEALGWKSSVDLRQMFERLIASMRMGKVHEQ